MKQPETALIVGAGSGLSASLARLFAKEGMRVALAAREHSLRSDLSHQKPRVARHPDRALDFLRV